MKNFHEKGNQQNPINEENHGIKSVIESNFIKKIERASALLAKKIIIHKTIGGDYERKKLFFSKNRTKSKTNK